MRQPPGHTAHLRSERMQPFVHALTGIVLMLKGISKLEHPAGAALLIAVSIGGGALVLLGTAFHRRLHRRVRHFDAGVSLVEGVACLLVGLVSIERGTQYIQFVWLVAAAGFTGAGVLKLLDRRVAVPADVLDVAFASGATSSSAFHPSESGPLTIDTLPPDAEPAAVGMMTTGAAPTPPGGRPRR